MNRQVTVFLPGIMGSVLSLDGEVIWPGKLAELVLPFARLRELQSDRLQATDIIRQYFVAEQYNSLLRLLARCGFREGDNHFNFPYDWRRSNARSADALASLLDSIVARHGAAVDIHLIGHSMGGLISRFYLESGLFAARPAYPRVRSLFTLGTPHRGSPHALLGILGYDRKVFLSAAQVRQVAADPRFPAVYQLLPPPGEPFVWDGQSAERFKPLDIYDASLASALGLSRENLDSARSFYAALDLARRPAHTRYFFFCGTRMATITGILLQRRNGYVLERLEAEDAGDGTVPSWSSHLNGVQNRPTGGEHSELYKNEELRRTLALLLGYTGTLEAVEAVEVCVRDPVIGPAAPLRVTLSVAAGVAALEGELRLERIDESPAGEPAFTPIGRPWPVTYSGANLERLHLTIDAPEYPGLYRVRFLASGSRSLGEDDFIVQLPAEE